MIGRDLIALLFNLAMDDIGPRLPRESWLWHGVIKREWSSDAVLLNFMHPLYSRLCRLRTRLAHSLPSAVTMSRDSFHLTLDGGVHFRVAPPDATYLSWPRDQMIEIWVRNRCELGLRDLEF